MTVDLTHPRSEARARLLRTPEVRRADQSPRTVDAARPARGAYDSDLYSELAWIHSHDAHAEHGEVTRTH